MFDVGDLLGDYELISRLSRGGMATLFLGRRVGAAPTDPPVAIKVIHETLSDDWQFVRMFIDEALISIRIRHPNVVRVEELGEKDERYYLVMEYVHGCTLAELLRTLGKQRRRMRPEIAMWIAGQVAAGLHAAHDTTGDDGQLLNVVHRDVSPQNILLSSNGAVKLLDFGIAKAAGRAERTEAGVIKGKIRYMAPEQARGKEIDRRVDIYALAVVLWEMLTMRRFVEGRNELEIIRRVREPQAVPPSRRGTGISERVDQAVMAALAVDPRTRPPTAAHFGRLLERANTTEPIGPPHVAELLRVFLGEELDRSAQAVPADVAPHVVRTSTDTNTLPGEDQITAEQVSKEDRSEALTMQIRAPAFEAEELEATRNLRPPEPWLPPGASADELDALLPSFAAVEDNERTMKATDEELRQFLTRIREDSGDPPARSKRPAPPLPARRHPPPSPQPSQPLQLPHHAFGPMVPRPTGAPLAPVPRVPLGKRAPATLQATFVRVAIITVFGFVVGAVLAVLWLHFGA